MGGRVANQTDRQTGSLMDRQKGSSGGVVWGAVTEGGGGGGLAVAVSLSPPLLADVTVGASPSARVTRSLAQPLIIAGTAASAMTNAY